MVGNYCFLYGLYAGMVRARVFWDFQLAKIG
jgi:hypothetical protein